MERDFFTTLVILMCKFYTIWWFLGYAEDIFLDDGKDSNFMIGQMKRWDHALQQKYDKKVMTGYLDPNFYLPYRFTIVRVLAYIYVLGTIIPLFGGCRVRKNFFKILLGVVSLIQGVLVLHPWIHKEYKLEGIRASSEMFSIFIGHGALALLAL